MNKIQVVNKLQQMINNNYIKMNKFHNKNLNKNLIVFLNLGLIKVKFKDFYLQIL